MEDDSTPYENDAPAFLLAARAPCPMSIGRQVGRTRSAPLDGQDRVQPS